MTFNDNIDDKLVYLSGCIKNVFMFYIIVSNRNELNLKLYTSSYIKYNVLCNDLKY